jgi:hypothetical protein
MSSKRIGVIFNPSTILPEEAEILLQDVYLRFNGDDINLVYPLNYEDKYDEILIISDKSKNQDVILENLKSNKISYIDESFKTSYLPQSMTLRRKPLNVKR